jgi:ribosome-binding protein aMBF1 (putative translation factor)
MVVCPVCGKATRVKHNVVDDKKVRVCAKCNAVLDKAYSKKAAKAAAAVAEEAPKKRTRKRAVKAEAETTENN